MLDKDREDIEKLHKAERYANKKYELIRMLDRTYRKYELFINLIVLGVVAIMLWAIPILRLFLHIH